MIAIVTAKDRAKYRFSLLIGKPTIGVEVVDGHTQVGASVDIARAGETDLVLREVGYESFFVRHGGVGRCGMIVFDTLWSEDVGGVRVCKDEVNVLLSIKVNT